jgi:hypothetical protein
MSLNREWSSESLDYSDNISQKNSSPGLRGKIYPNASSLGGKYKPWRRPSELLCSQDHGNEWVGGAVRRDADTDTTRSQAASSGAEAKNVWSYNSTSPYRGSLAIVPRVRSRTCSKWPGFFWNDRRPKEWFGSLAKS